MKVYHASNEEFSFPSFEASDTLKKQRSPKAFLGFYVAHDRSLIEGIGTYLYELEIDVNEHTTINLPLTAMIEMYDTIGRLDGDPDEKWKGLRKMYGESAYIIHIVEDDGRIGESAIVNLSCIKKFTRIK